jgi:N utilization substance protein B
MEAKKTGGRHASRELALRALFQMDLAGISLEEAFAAVSDPDLYLEETITFGRELLEGTVAHRERIDAIIERHAIGWTLERMAGIDRNVLRLAVYELLYRADIPASVTVDEAVELAKDYSTAESGRYVNGVLGDVVRHLEQEQAAE